MVVNPSLDYRFRLVLISLPGSNYPARENSVYTGTLPLLPFYLLLFYLKLKQQKTAYPIPDTEKQTGINLRSAFINYNPICTTRTYNPIENGGNEGDRRRWNLF